MGQIHDMPQPEDRPERRIGLRDVELMFFPDTLDDVRERLLDAVADEIRRQDKEDEDDR